MEYKQVGDRGSPSGACVAVSAMECLSSKRDLPAKLPNRCISTVSSPSLFFYTSALQRHTCTSHSPPRSAARFFPPHPSQLCSCTILSFQAHTSHIHDATSSTTCALFSGTDTRHTRCHLSGSFCAALLTLSPPLHSGDARSLAFSTVAQLSSTVARALSNCHTEQHLCYSATVKRTPPSPQELSYTLTRALSI